MKVILLGAGGMLGTEVRNVLNEKGITYHRVGITEDHSWKQELHDPDYQVLINCAGELTSADPVSQIRINAIVPYLARFHFSGRIIHVSTDCVFSGNVPMSYSYSRHDVPDPTSTYGASKRMGELACNEDDLVVRTSFIGLRHGLLQWAIDHAGQEVSGYQRAIWSGSTCRVIARNLVDLIDSKHSGIIHLSTLNPIRKFDLLNLINDMFQLNLQIKSSYLPEINRALLPTVPITDALDDALKELYDEYISSDPSRSLSR